MSIRTLVPFVALILIAGVAWLFLKNLHITKQSDDIFATLQDSGSYKQFSPEDYGFSFWHSIDCKIDNKPQYLTESEQGKITTAFALHCPQGILDLYLLPFVGGKDGRGTQNAYIAELQKRAEVEPNSHTPELKFSSKKAFTMGTFSGQIVELGGATTSTEYLFSDKQQFYVLRIPYKNDEEKQELRKIVDMMRQTWESK